MQCALRFACAIAACAALPARAQDNPACARYEDALAYNACLAKLGPQAHASRAASEGLSGLQTTRVHGRVHSVFAVARQPNGRMRAVFDVGPAPKKKRALPDDGL